MIEQYTPRFLNKPESNGYHPAPDKDVACPACSRSDVVSRASSVARAGRGRFLLEDGSAAVFETELASMLAEPKRPASLPASIIVAAFAVGWLLLALNLAIVQGLRAQDWASISPAALDTAQWLGIAWFGLLIPGVAMIRYFARRELVARETPAWREASKKWREVHYCSRDDVVFVPGEGRAFAPEHASLLFQTIAVVPDAPRPAPATMVEEPE